MSRNFLSLHPYFEDGIIMGRKQANMGFINALFRKDPFQMYHFFVDNPQSLAQRWKEEPAAQPLLKRGALHAFPRTHLEKRLKIVPYSVCHLSDPMTEFAAMCQVRNAFSSKLFPITAVNHTISYVEYAAPTLGHIWQGCSPRDGIGCTSASSKAIMEAWYAHARQTRSIPNQWRQPQLDIIPLGVPDPELGQGHEQTETLRQSLREKFGVASETVFLLLYGRISIVDKMDVRPLFLALRRLRAKHPQLPFFLCIAGSMDGDDELKEQLQALATTWNISFALLPNPTREDKKYLFAAADVFVSPVDNIQETFGLTLVEAAQSALPVIASDWDGYRDIIVQGETGFLVPTYAPIDTPNLDALAGVLFNKIHQLFRSQQTSLHVPSLEKVLYALISDGALRRSMGQKAKERAARLYTFDTVVEDWLNFWQKLENAPISSEEESLIRQAKHPYALDFGKVFSVYASHSLQSETLLQCTDLGRAYLYKEISWNNYCLAAVSMVESLIHKLLECCLMPCSVAELVLVAHAAPWGKAHTQEVLLAHIHWLLKQDLVECALE